MADDDLFPASIFEAEETSAKEVCIVNEAVKSKEEEPIAPREAVEEIKSDSSDDVRGKDNVHMDKEEQIQLQKGKCYDNFHLSGIQIVSSYYAKYLGYTVMVI